MTTVDRDLATEEDLPDREGDPYAAFGFTFGTPNWGLQGADAGLYDNSDIHAIRILARAWLRVIWRAWSDRKPYDPQLHLGAIRASKEGG